MTKQSPGYSLPKAPQYLELPAAKPRATRSGPELGELRVRLEVVTPILGGSHQTRAIDDVDVIRAPSVRGHLRVWWRALYAAQCANADALYQRESALWGRAATDDGGRSAVEVRVRPGEATCIRWSNVWRQGVEPVRRLTGRASAGKLGMAPKSWK